MAHATLKEMARDQELKAGHFIVEFATPGIGQILAAAGCDFALFDTEHSGFGHETTKSVLRYMQAAKLPTIVRVPSKDYHHIARALDMGAEGIMLPMVGTRKEAQHIVQCMKYVPAGRRGVALGIAHDRYAPGPTMEKLAAANERTTLFAQIETAEGVRNADRIADLEGVDCLWVGHFDLSCSLGIPGEFEHPDFLAATAKVIEACRRRGKAAGRLVASVEDGEARFAEGFDFICYSGDVWALQAAVSAGVDALRRSCKGKAGGQRPASATRRKTPAKKGRKRK